MCTYVQTTLKSQTRAKCSMIASRMIPSKVPLHIHAEWEEFVMKSQNHKELFHYLKVRLLKDVSVTPKHYLLTMKDNTALNNIRWPSYQHCLPVCKKKPTHE